MRIGEIYQEFEPNDEPIRSSEKFIEKFKPEIISIPAVLFDTQNNNQESYSEEQDDGKNETGETIEVYKFRHDQKIPFELPPGFCLEGGAARAIMLSALGELTLSPRDYDIVAVKDFNPDTKLIPALSSKYMPDDYQHGYGVDQVEMNSYFSTRDFTINEILIDSENAYISAQALQDLIDKSIRPTEYEKNSWYSNYYQEYGIDPKLAMKAVRLHAEFKEMYGKGSIQEIAEWQWNFREVPLFHLALALNKACQLGDKVSIRFYAKLIELGVVDFMDNQKMPSGHSISSLAVNIRYRMNEMGRDPFEYSDAQLAKTVELLELDQDHQDDFKKYEELAAKYCTN